ncbi:hypothetical protein [Paracoccus laeviglucosivorans]|uniref:DUF2946 domain-containing protein n=1 Tax=Paracoccus laeviglucosivorans TaxID=1197861 RepID=A0A521AH26_9RHOB|nr:hypothetical protein [Paracoccus laeviglucosivorans]SMO34106.1 hypothetical protein SAMN06265221_101120 [Paracoccus laeviglucosivorans]
MAFGRTATGTGNGAIRATLSRLLRLLVVLPFLGFSLIQPDTMLTADAQGRVMVVLCGSDTPVEMAVAADGTLTPVSELDRHAPGDRHPSCGWALHGQPVLGAGPALLPASQTTHVVIDPGPFMPGGLWSLPRPAPSARGPPSIV